MRQRNHVFGDWARNGSGLYLPPAQARSPVAIDLFCGCGGMGLGFEAAGFHVAAASENDPLAACSYLYNLGHPGTVIHYLTPADRARLEKALAENGCTPGGNREGNCDHFFFGDVRQLRGEQVLEALGMQRGEVTVVTGGPPCQGFSRANAGRSCMDPRNSLVFEFTRLVLEIEPITMVMENVPDILNMDTPEGIPVVDAICLELEKGGWNYSRLRKALLGQAGARAVTRGRQNHLEAPEAEDGPAYEQQDLFAEVGA